MYACIHAYRYTCTYTCNHAYINAYTHPCSPFSILHTMTVPLLSLHISRRHRPGVQCGYWFWKSQNTTHCSCSGGHNFIVHVFDQWVAMKEHPCPVATAASIFLIYHWAEARIKIARMTLTIKLDGNWSSFQLANNTPPLSVTGSVIAPSARMELQATNN